MRYTTLFSRIKDKDVSDDVKEDLCKLCNGTCKQDATEGYQDYAGAFFCMAEGNNDRVGFVKQSTPNEVFNKYGNKYGTKNGYKLLVVKNNVSDEDLKSMQDLLKVYSLADLVKNGMATKDVVELKLHDGTLKEYVGEYGKYINVLTGNFPTIAPAASSITISLALQIIAFVALALLY